MFEILPLNCEKSFHECRYNGCAVGRNILSREIFERMFQKSRIDFFVCKCQYMYHGPQYIILFDNLSMLKNDKKGFYLSGYNDEKLYLNRDNIKIICTKKECDVTEPWVKLYVISK